MPKKSVSSAVLKKIQNKEIAPKAKWKFLCKKLSLWFIVIVSMAFGALTSSIVIFRFSTKDWIWYDKFNNNWFKFFIENISYIWVVALFLFIFILYYTYKMSSPTAHRQSKANIIANAIIIVNLVGIALFGFDIPKKLEKEVMERIPSYRQVKQQRQLSRWLQVEKGFIAGVIIDTNQEKSAIRIKDVAGVERNIFLPKQLTQNIPLQIGTPIKILGEQTQEGGFNATDIQIWYGNFVTPEGAIK